MNRLIPSARMAAITVSTLGVALVAAASVIWFTGGHPVQALLLLMRGAVGSPYAIESSMANATPLIFAGLAVTVALRCGLFNIGVEGQLLMGGLAAAIVGAALPSAPLALHLPLALVSGSLAGGVWSAVPAFLKAWRGAHEVIVTIMMNYLALELTHFLVNGVLRDNTTQMVATRMIAPTAYLWRIPGVSNLSLGFPLAIAAACLLHLILTRTSLGYEIRACGEGSHAAEVAGIQVGKTMIIAMVMSGALAGCAGAIEILAVHHRYIDGFSPGYGFDSIAVALLAGLQSPGVVLAALFFGGLNAGAVVMETAGAVPRQIAGVVQACVILGAAVRFVRGPGPLK